MDNLKVLSLFSGIGSFEKALDNLGIEYSLINYSDSDKFASKSYSILHNVKEELNLGDITKINETLLEDFDLLTYGFPCQSFSIAGKKLGFNDLERGNLFFDVMRIANYKRPKFMIAENVRNLCSHDKGDTFRVITNTLESLGYNNYYKILNSIDFEIPQSRERIFIVSIRKDIDDGSFKFSKGRRTNKNVSEFLDIECNKREITSCLIPYLVSKYHRPFKVVNGVIKVFDGIVQNYFTSGFSTKRLYSIHGNSPTLTTDKRTTFLEIQGELNNKERLKLQGFTEIDYFKLKGIIPERQLCKLSGNSITVNVLESIFSSLFK